MKEAILHHFRNDWRPFYESYLGSLKSAGKEYSALCPLHEDHNPSLTVNATSGEWFCHACKIGGDAFTLVEKITGSNFPDALQDISLRFGITDNGNTPKPATTKKLIKRYTYHDASGADLFYKNRYQPKNFSLSRPNGKGAFINNMKGIEPVLYRLPEVMAAEEVWVVEGEKDADALTELGIVATTNFDGADKWSRSYSEVLRGKHVILTPDDDESGRRHVQKVAMALHGVAASIKILALPNPNNKKGYDVSDFLAEQVNGTAATDRLASMVESAADWTPETNEEKPNDERHQLHDQDDADCFLELLTESDPDSTDQYEWLIDHLVPKGEPMVIAGKGASGKSSLALEFSAQIMEKDPDASVVYICAEGTYKDSKVKARMMGLYKHNRFHFLMRQGGGTSFKLSENRDLKLVTKVLANAKGAGKKIVFVVIDSIRGMARGSLNEDAIGEVMHAINGELCGKLGITVCYIHHGRKNDRDMAAMDAFLGSVTIVNAVRYALLVRKTAQRRTVEVAKSNLGNDDIVFSSTINDATSRIQLTCTGILGAEDGGDPSKLEIAQDIILSYLGQGEEVPAYVIYNRGEAQGISGKTMQKAKKELNNVKCYQKGKGKGCWYWRLTDTVDAPPESPVSQEATCPPRQSNLNLELCSPSSLSSP